MMVPTAIITVEATTPISSWKLPVAEDLPIFIALSMKDTRSKQSFFLVIVLS
jgi:hypothetical protein